MTSLSAVILLPLTEYNRKDYEGDGAEMDRSLDDLINILNPNHNNPGGHEFEEDEEESEE